VTAYVVLCLPVITLLPTTITNTNTTTATATDETAVARAVLLGCTLSAVLLSVALSAALAHALGTPSPSPSPPASPVSPPIEGSVAESWAESESRYSNAESSSGRRARPQTQTPKSWRRWLLGQSTVALTALLVAALGLHSVLLSNRLQTRGLDDRYTGSVDVVPDDRPT